MRKQPFTINLLYIVLLLIVFSVPLDGLSIEIGATFRLSRIFSLLATFIIFVHLFFRDVKNSRSFYLVIKVLAVFFFITILGNITFLLDVPNPEAQSYYLQRFGSSSLSIFRNELKFIQVLIENISKFSCLLIPILVIRSYDQVSKVAWTYVISSSLQAALGILQLSYYLIAKINLFPIYRGGLIGERTYTQDAVASIQEVGILRINALSGEPKNLALFLCFGIATICFFLLPESFTKPRRNFLLLLNLVILQIVALTLTLSTLGYILFIIGIFVFMLSAKSRVKLIFTFFLLGLSLLVFYGLFEISSFYTSVFQTRFLERLGLEDFDLVYLAFIQDSPSYLFLGTGFGNFHLASFQNAIEIVTWKFGIILPKLGIFEILAISGVLGLAFFSFLPYKLLSRFSQKNLSSNFNTQKNIRLKNLIIYMIIAGIYLRLTYIGIIWIGIGFAVSDNWLINSQTSIQSEDLNSFQKY